MRGIRLCNALIISFLLVACTESATGPTELPFDVAPAFGHVSGGTSPLPVIDEHFDDGSLTPGLEYSSAKYEITGDKIKRIVGSSAADEDREYVQTEAGGYLDEDFTAEVTFTINATGSTIGAAGGFIHYFGIGPTPPDATYYNESSGFFFRIHGTAKAGGLVQAAFRPTGDGGAFADWIATFPNRLGAGAGTHRARIVKAGNVLSFSIDENNDGSWWPAITKDLTTLPFNPTFLTSANSHIYFGTGSDVDTFDDLSIVLLDTDGDGLPDNVDNCPFDANSDQSNVDQNGEGDACQTVYTSGTHIDTWDPILPPIELVGGRGPRGAQPFPGSAWGSVRAPLGREWPDKRHSTWVPPRSRGERTSPPHGSTPSTISVQ